MLADYCRAAEEKRAKETDTEAREIKIFRNDAISVYEIKALNPKGVILSPGPGRPENAGICLSLIKEIYQTVPILGVCLGHQAIGAAFGANVKRSDPCHGRASDIDILVSDPLFASVPTRFQAGRYHSLAVFSPPPTLTVLARETESSGIMALKHQDFPCYGIQFHPESLLTQFGDRLIENFVGFSKNENTQIKKRRR